MVSPPRKKHRRPSVRRFAPLASSEKILEAIPDMIFRIDRDGRYVGYKPANGVEPYVPPEEFLGRRIADIMPRHVADEAMAAVHDVLAGGQPRAFEYELLEEGGLRRYETRVVPLNDDEVLAIVRLLSISRKRAGGRGRRAPYALTNRELAVLEAVASGQTDKQVAQLLSISPLTVRKHIASIRKKMGAQSRTEASVRALREGLLE